MKRLAMVFATIIVAVKTQAVQVGTSSQFDDTAIGADSHAWSFVATN